MSRGLPTTWTYKFFTYICPLLYDLGTVAYWILEKDAHSQKFKANLRHITQVVLELYKRKDKLWIKALKLDGRPNREAFKPHSYVVSAETIAITSAMKEPMPDIGNKIKELRMKHGMSQKELAAKLGVTPELCIAAGKQPDYSIAGLVFANLQYTWRQPL